MRKDHRPFYIKKLLYRLNATFVRHWIAPQFDQLGENLGVHKPRYLELTGTQIAAGDNLHIICARHKPVSIGTWRSKQGTGQITIGNHVLISPGVSILAAGSIHIGHNTMLASDVYISDCDWHGIYNRTRPFRCTSPVTLGENVWVGNRAIINKGVTIGDNSIVAAGSVVISDIPKNTVYGGNPAKQIKTLDPAKRMLKREFLFQQKSNYWENQLELSQYLLAENSLAKWLKSLCFPSLKD